MINKKILLGKVPQELGVKDAVHVAIVSVRASCAMNPGTKCNVEKGEAIPNAKGVGVADPFLKKIITRGQNILLLLNPDEVDNVTHSWDHKMDFSPPTTPVNYDQELVSLAFQYGVTYEQLLEGMQKVIDSDHKGYGNYSSAPYPGSKSQEEIEEIEIDTWSAWSAFSEETLFEFENVGSACCPEYNYPECSIFEVKS